MKMQKIQTLLIQSTAKHLHIFSSMTHKRNRPKNTLNTDVAKYQNLKLDAVLPPLIHKIATYLAFNELIKFEKTSSSIFIGCRSSPTPSHSLNSQQFARLFIQYSKKDPSRIRLYKSIALNGTNLYAVDKGKYPVIQWHHYQLFQHLQELHLDLMTKRNSSWYRQERTGELLDNLSECQDLTNIKRLKISGRWFEYVEALQQSIEKMNLEFIAFPSHEDYAFFSDYKWIKKVRGIVAASQRMQKEITDELESYHFSSFCSGLKGKLRNLKELCFVYSPDEDAKDGQIGFLLNEDFSKLKRINLIHHKRANDIYVALNTCTQFYVHRRFWGQTINGLEYIGLDIKCADVFMKFVVEAMTGISGKRDRMKIRIDGDNESFFRDDMMNLLQKLMVLLDLRYDNWMIICHSMELMLGDDLIQQFLGDALIHGCTVRCYDAQDGDVCIYNFVISNSGCNIDGYKERWIMECPCCEQIPVDMF